MKDHKNPKRKLKKQNFKINDKGKFFELYFVAVVILFFQPVFSTSLLTYKKKQKIISFQKGIEYREFQSRATNYILDIKTISHKSSTNQNQRNDDHQSTIRSMNL